MQLPVSTMIETARLRMRPHRLDDLDVIIAMRADPRLAAQLGGIPSTRHDTWMRLLRYAGHWATLGFGYWAVEERETAAFIGEVGFADHHRELEPSLDGVPELGWLIAASAQGKGYATEAALAAIAWGRQYFPIVDRIACIIPPENLASIRVAEKCGFTLVSSATFLQLPILMYDRPLHAEPEGFVLGS